MQLDVTGGISKGLRNCPSHKRKRVIRAHSEEVFAGLRSLQQRFVHLGVLLPCLRFPEPGLQLAIKRLTISKQLEQLLVVKRL